MTATLTAPSGKTDLITVTPQTVEEATKGMLSLKINGIADKTGMTRVSDARKICVKLRTTLDKEHKIAKADALAECRRIDETKRDLLALIAPVERHLTDEESRIAAELDRIQKERDDAIYADRVAKLDAQGCSFAESYVRGLTPSQFAEFLAKAIADAAERKATEARIAAEQERQRIEREKLDAERAELAKQRAEQQAEAARLRKIEDDRRAEQQKELDRQQAEIAAERQKLEAEQRRLAEEERIRQRQADMERATREAEERATREAEAKLAREADERERQQREEAARIAREAAERPDREKLIGIATAIQAIPMPEVAAEFASHVSTIQQIIAVAVRQIRVAATAAK